MGEENADEGDDTNNGDRTVMLAAVLFESCVGVWQLVVVVVVMRLAGSSCCCSSEFLCSCRRPLFVANGVRSVCMLVVVFVLMGVVDILIGAAVSFCVVATGGGTCTLEGLSVRGN